MKLIQTPVKGMQDFLPEDMALRQHVLGVIRETYARYGFCEIETPVMEHIENLTGKNGGENEKLIFKVEKRGRELEKSLQKIRQADGISTDAAGTELSDSALRYDLTVPLCRYYSNHKNELPSPFKALQIGNVFRADRPQKGRFRQFTQCDIDIIGDASVMAEIELIAATCDALHRIFSEVGVSGFTVHVGDRRILRAMAKSAGFEEQDFDEVFIILDKMDKIGVSGVREELIQAGYDTDKVDRYVGFFSDFAGDEAQDPAAFIRSTCADCVENGVEQDIGTILSAAGAMISDDITLKFDPTLVRGMSYYTGTIFEISIDNYSFSIAGGGRYDKMVGRFCGQDAPACGFSIGFERIVTILRDLGWKEPGTAARKAYLVDMKSAQGRITEVFSHAAKERAEGIQVVVQPLKKNAKFQVEALEKSGYTEIRKVYGDTQF
ncbi:MAG TPA: histidine--tRNA ligase [Lachnospiraceae bacterium]|nr:histidine--tRNA ligase [Lachnospiraceae bacterium]